jgi:hypothetical protein
MGNGAPEQTAALARFRAEWKPVNHGEMPLPSGEKHRYRLDVNEYWGRDSEVERGYRELTIHVIWLPEGRPGHVKTAYGDGAWPVIEVDAESGHQVGD